MQLKATFALVLLSLLFIDFGSSFRIRFRSRGLKKVFRKSKKLFKKYGPKVWKYAKKAGKAGYKIWKKYPLVRKIISKGGCAALKAYDATDTSSNNYLNVMMESVQPDSKSGFLVLENSSPNHDEINVYTADDSDVDENAIKIPVMTQDEWNNFMKEIDQTMDESDALQFGNEQDQDDNVEFTDDQI